MGPWCYLTSFSKVNRNVCISSCVGVCVCARLCECLSVSVYPCVGMHVFREYECTVIHHTLNRRAECEDRCEMAITTHYPATHDPNFTTLHTWQPYDHHLAELSQWGRDGRLSFDLEVIHAEPFLASWRPRKHILLHHFRRLLTARWCVPVQYQIIFENYVYVFTRAAERDETSRREGLIPNKPLNRSMANKLNWRSGTQASSLESPAGKPVRHGQTQPDVWRRPARLLWVPGTHIFKAHIDGFTLLWTSAS